MPGILGVSFAALALVQPSGLVGFPALADLARLRSSRVGFVSSADPSGKNDDGFSGAHSFLRREGDGLVIGDFRGPGVVTRIWTPTPTDDPVEFFFDGETSPRIRVPMRDLFSGTVAPFLGPLVGSGAGGYFSYVPLRFARSLVIVVRGTRIQFHQINVATGDADRPVESYRPEHPDAERDAATRLLGASGTALAAAAAPPGARIVREAVDRTLRPGTRTVLFTRARGGRLVGLRIGPASSLQGLDRSTAIRIHWDDAREPAVEAPLADLLGWAWDRPAMAGLLAGTASDTGYLWLPMPFDRSATIELEHAAEAPARAIHAEAFWADVPRRPDEGRFYAVWRRENPTTVGQPFRFLEAAGRGQVVGVTLQAQGLGTDGTPFFEGDDRVVIDGDTVVRGTGSEDAFNGGWYDVPGRWDGPRAFPLSGSLGYSNPLARTGAYRFFLADAYVWRRHISFTIEHGEDTGNTVPTDYSAVVFFYADGPPGWRSSPFTEASRRPTNPSRITLNPGWSSPIAFFSTQHGVLTKRPERGIGRLLSFVGDSTPDFGRHVLTLTAPIPAAGRYRISVLPVMGPDQGTVQLLVDDQPAGREVATAADTRRAGELVALGEVVFSAGEGSVHLKIAPGRAATRRAALDLIRVVLERVPPN